MTYTYKDGSSNQLAAVTDGGDINEGFKDGNTTGDDYLYDANGNLTSDLNKGIATIEYNPLNLPVKVTKDANNYIEYIYDAAGIKLAQVVHQESTDVPAVPLPVKTTYYMGEFIYEKLDANPMELQLINHEEGRIVKDDFGNWEYQYHLKDHLGNVRVTFRAKAPETDTYLATFEPANLTLEMEVFENIDPADIDTYNAADNPMGDGENDVLKLDLSNQLASTLALTVQKGDVIDLGVWAYTDIDYNSFGNSSGQTALTGMIASAFGGISGGIGEAGSIYSGIEQGLTLFGESSKTDGTPSAHLNFLLFDKDFTPVNGGFAGITASGVQQYLTFTPLTIDESGYIFIFLTFGNDAGRVFFDDMKVEHTKNSKIVQQDDYYPFGLSFNSWQRGGSKKNDYLFNGIERQDELDIGWDLAFYRSYSPELGRWHQIDPKVNLYYNWSPYHAMGNNPIKISDPLGDRWKTEDDRKEAESVSRGLNKTQRKYERQEYRLDRKITKLNNKGKTEKANIIQGKKDEITDRKEEVIAAQTEITDITNDQNMTFRFNDLGKEATEGFISSDNDGTVVINHNSSTANKIHELKHAHQIQQGDITIVPGTGTFDYSGTTPINSEVDAYKRQMAAGYSLPTSNQKTPRKLSEVSKRYVREIYYFDDNRNVVKPYGGVRYIYDYR